MIFSANPIIKKSLSMIAASLFSGFSVITPVEAEQDGTIMKADPALIAQKCDGVFETYILDGGKTGQPKILNCFLGAVIESGIETGCRDLQENIGITEIRVFEYGEAYGTHNSRLWTEIPARIQAEELEQMKKARAELCHAPAPSHS